VPFDMTNDLVNPDDRTPNHEDPNVPPRRKRGRAARVILLFFLVILLLPCALYRIPRGCARPFEREVRYQLIDIGHGDWPRHTFESILGNHRLFLVDAPWVYVSPEDRRRCWPESPWDMMEKGYTNRVRFRARPLRLGGYGPAEIIEVRRVKGTPVIRK
jgi:hypothetical protein